MARARAKNSRFCNGVGGLTAVCVRKVLILNIKLMQDSIALDQLCRKKSRFQSLKKSYAPR